MDRRGPSPAPCCASAGAPAGEGGPGGRTRATLAALDRARAADCGTLAAARERELAPIRDALASAAAAVRDRFPDWASDAWQHWSPPETFAHAAPFARLRVSGVEAPLLLTFPDHGSVLFETRGPARDGVAPSMTNLMLRLLTSSPPGKLRFTIVDPVALGQNFAGIMHLADYEDSLVNGRIGPSRRTSRNSLPTSRAHGKGHPDLSAQRVPQHHGIQRAGRAIAEKYHFLVVADFPAGLSDLAPTGWPASSPSAAGAGSTRSCTGIGGSRPPRRPPSRNSGNAA
jgi:hypothetical protein